METKPKRRYAPAQSSPTFDLFILLNFLLLLGIWKVLSIGGLLKSSSPTMQQKGVLLTLAEILVLAEFILFLIIAWIQS